MTTLRRTFAAILFLALVRPTNGARADTIVTDWDVGTSVTDFSGPDTIRDIQFSDTVVNPFIATHDTLLPPAEFAITDFDFAWSEAADTGSFEVAFDQGLTLGSHVANASGNIFLTSTVPLLLDLSALMNFTSSPGDEARFLLTVSITDADTNENFFAALQVGGNGHFGQPASGTLAFSADDILLPAGIDIRLSYTYRSSSPSVDILNGPMSNDGFINWSFTPVPEPSTAALLLISTPVLLRRRAGPR